MDKQFPMICVGDKGTYRVHFLKTVQPYYDAVAANKKKIEIRKFDRDYKIGDVLFLIEYDAEKDVYYEGVLRKVSYIMTTDDHEGIREGFVAMSLSVPSPDEIFDILATSEVEFQLSILNK